MKYRVEEGRERERKSYYIDVGGFPQAFIAAGISFGWWGFYHPTVFYFHEHFGKERERERGIWVAEVFNFSLFYSIE